VARLTGIPVFLSSQGIPARMATPPYEGGKAHLRYRAFSFTCDWTTCKNRIQCEQPFAELLTNEPTHTTGRTLLLLSRFSAVSPMS
jgi:hypothetical protein